MPMQTVQSSSSLYYKLISLWIVVEAFLGGIIHGLNLPISGLLVSSGAVICLCLIGYYCNTKKAIIQATIIVAIFKVMLSPQAPPTAYIAVFFQGIIAQFLFKNTNYFKIKSIVLAMLALVESGMQKIIVLTILYGNTFFDALNKFVTKVLHSNNYNNYSLYIAIVYLIIHIIAAVFVGRFAATLPQNITIWKQKYPLLMVDENVSNTKITPINTSKKRMQYYVLLTVVICSILFYCSHINILPKTIFYIVIRTVVLLIVWLFFVKPIAQYVVQKWMINAKQKHITEIQLLFNILPLTLYIVKQCWLQAATQKHENRFKLFAKLVIVNVVS